jgi:hypothetical protein
MSAQRIYYNKFVHGKKHFASMCKIVLGAIHWLAVSVTLTNLAIFQLNNIWPDLREIFILSEALTNPAKNSVFDLRAIFIFCCLVVLY